MASLELVDHTQGLNSWYLPQQQHGAQQPHVISGSKERTKGQKKVQKRFADRS